MEYGELNSEKNIYTQIAGKIRDAIMDGVLIEGERIPSAATMAAGWGANHQTVLNAMHVLVMDRLLQKMRGAGTFVMAGAKQTIEDEENGLFDTLMIPMLVERALVLGRNQKEIIGLIKKEFEIA